MIKEANSLLFKVGVIMMALAVALVIAAAVVSATLGSEPERVVPAEVATQSPGEAPRYSSGEEGSATTKSSSEKESPRYLSGEEEALGYGSSSSGEPQAVVQQEAERLNSQPAMPQLADQQTPSEAFSEPEPQPQHYQPQQQEQLLPGSEERRWSGPTEGELQSANGPRHYELFPGAIMGLTIEAIGIYNASVFDSNDPWALDYGVAHHPETSLPWSQGAQRNVYLAGHRLGFRGTWSRMIFYNLDKLEKGDEVLLRDQAGRSYRYRVSEVFETYPEALWVMGQVRGRDMLTLQTCTLPTFEKRLIVRADRV